MKCLLNKYIELMSYRDVNSGVKKCFRFPNASFPESPENDSFDVGQTEHHSEDVCQVLGLTSGVNIVNSELWNDNKYMYVRLVALCRAHFLVLAVAHIKIINTKSQRSVKKDFIENL